MRDQQKRRICRRLLKHLQQCIGGLSVHFIRSVHDDHAAPAIRRRQTKKTVQCANIFGPDHVAEPTGIRRRSDDGLQPRLSARLNTACHGMFGIDVQGLRRWGRPEHVIFLNQRCCQQKACDPIGQRGFPNPFWARQHPSVMHPP